MLESWLESGYLRKLSASSPVSFERASVLLESPVSQFLQPGLQSSLCLSLIALFLFSVLGLVHLALAVLAPDVSIPGPELAY